jgi:MFS family permease
MFKQITRTVWFISLISLFNDCSSEMLYPIFPLYLAQIGYGTVFIGFMEGVAECVAGLTKIYTGSLSDKFQKRLPFIQVGYALSILSKPIIGLLQYAFPILLSRTSDRIGKGIRSGARDAMLGDESTYENRAEVFGFHRSMDTIGAIIGPLIAMLYLHFHPDDYKTIFLITIVPGIFALVITFLLKDKKMESTQVKTSYTGFSHFTYLKRAPKAYIIFLIPLLIFSLINSSDMFLLLRAKEIGFSTDKTIFLYLLFTIAFALFAYPIGKLADKFGRMRMLKFGLCLYAIAYFIFASADTYWAIVVGFILYGLYYAFTQGIIKTIFISLVPANEKASAIGLYEGINSFGLLFASFFAGIIWNWQGSNFLFFTTASICFLIVLCMQILNKKFSIKK